MSRLLHNMSAPPRSQVCFQQEQLKEYVVFNPFALATLLGADVVGIEQKAKAYLQQHGAAARKPSGYMIAETIDTGVGYKTVKDKLKQYRYEDCRDIELMILVFGSTVGDLYIPNREPSFESSRFDKVLLFPKDEVYV